MTQTTPAATKKVQRRGPGKLTPQASTATLQARRRAAVMLEVLAGLRTPAQAATELGISTPRYYLLENQALEGLIKGCEPRMKGPGRSPQRQVEQLQRRVKLLEAQLHRQQALARAAQRAIGLSGKSSSSSQVPQPGKRRRRPAVRALRLAQRLKSDTPQQPSPMSPAEASGNGAGS